MKKIIISILVVLSLFCLWGCSTEQNEETEEQPFTVEEELAINFLYTLAVNYGESPYDVKLYSTRVFRAENECYYVAVDASVEGINDGERTVFGNEIGFLEGEQVTFSNKEASAYKFFEENNLAVSKGEKLDEQKILEEYTARVKEKIRIEKESLKIEEK